MINFTLICDPTISRSNQNKLLFLDTFECLKSLLFCRYGNYRKKKSRLLGMVRLLTFFQARTMKFCVLRLKNCKSLRFIYINIVSLKQESIRHVHCRNNSIINSHALIKLIGLQWYSDFLTEISPNLATGETFRKLLPVLKLLNSGGQHYKKTPYQTKLTPKHCKSNAEFSLDSLYFYLLWDNKLMVY